MAVLYRKYRPQTFLEVLNQKSIIQTLKNQISMGQISHAYLFTGSRGVGKTSIARIMAKAVNCLSAKEGEPCGQCNICTQVAGGNFLDLVEIDAASNTGVDNIRELIEHVKFSPSIGAYKVFIIDEVHMLSKGAFNALLKTLEEPPRHAIFILATTEINKVPPTIISRTQRFDFKVLSALDIEGHLKNILSKENIKLGNDILQLVALNADGSVRDALSLLDKILTLGEGASLEDCEKLLGITDISVSQKLLELIAEGQANKLPDFYNELLERGQDFAALNRDFLEYLRKALVIKITNNQVQQSLAEEHKKTLEHLAGLLAVNDLIFIVRLFLRSYKELGSSPSAQLPMLLASVEASLKKAPSNSVFQNGELENNLALNSAELGAKSTPPKIAQELETKKDLDAQFDASINLEEIEPKWPQLIDNIWKVNCPLANLVKNSTLLEVSGGRVVLGVKFLFHKQSLENQKNSAILKQAFKEVFNKNLGILGKVVKEEEAVSPKISTAEVLADALKVFGGEVIE